MKHNSLVLIVDDKPQARELLETLLITEGYYLAFASNGEEALANAAELTPDLILLDVMMPGMTGFEVCRRLRADPHLAEIPVIMVTALDDRDSRLQGIEAGADDFVSKPFDRVELQTRVRAITRLNRYRRLLLERTYRQQAEEEIYQRNRELTLLNHVITAAASTLNVQETLYVACEALADAFELPHATAMLLNEEQMQFTAVVDYLAPWVSLEQTRLDEGQTPGQGDTLREEIPVVGLLSEYLLEYKTPLAVIAGETDPRLARVHDLMHAYGLGTLLMVPILMRDQIVGVIELKAIERRHFSDQDLTLAQSVATAIGQAMETVQLHQSLRYHVDGLEKTVAQRTLELQTERDRTQAILEALGEAVVVTDMAGIIQYLNPAAVALTGFTNEEAQGQSWHLWQSQEAAEDRYEEILAAVRTGQTWRGEVVNQRKDGSTYDAALTVAPLFGSENRAQPIGIVSVQRDISPLKEAQRAKTKFVSDVSHELRTPLSVITLLGDNLDTLYERLAEGKRRQMIRDIQKHTQVLNNLLGDILEISRIESGRMPMERERVDLTQLAREEVDELLPMAQQKAQNLRVNGVEPLTVWGNDNQLRQVIRNLLNNAIKYTPEKGQITCECRFLSSPLTEEAKENRGWPGSIDLPPGRWVALRVVDTGIGINEEHLPYLFERFYRVKSQVNIRGTGLGLSIARELIELHSGRIAVASSLGEGAVFALYLPLLEKE